MRALPAGLNDNIRDLLIKRVALVVQLCQLGTRVNGLQQRATAIMPGTLP